MRRLADEADAEGMMSRGPRQARTLAARGVPLRLVEALASVRDLIREELGMSVGEVSRWISIDDAIAAATSST